MSYTRTTWANGTAPAISAGNLNNIEVALVGLDARAVIIDSDYATLALALAATATGGELEIRGTYTVTSPFTISKACTIRFRQGASITASSGHAIDITASNVTLQQPVLVGSGSGTAGTACGIRAVGTVGTPITGLRIIEPTISAFNQYGIYLEHVRDFSVEKPLISSVAYAGIMALSCLDGAIRGGAIRTVTQPSGFANSYGIAITRSSAQSLVNAPRSARIAVAGVVITDVPWEGIETHAATDITFTQNVIYGCNVGIALVPGDDTGGVDTYAPQRCVVFGNVIDSQVSNGTKSNGILLAGAGITLGTPVEYAAGCLILGNTVVDHGTENSATNTGAAVLLYNTRGAVVAGNSIIRPGRVAFQVYNTNADLLLASNLVEDVWTSGAACAVVWLRSTFNTVTVSGTRMVRGAKSATLVNDRGIWASTTSNNDIVDGGGNNWAVATFPYASVTGIIKAGTVGGATTTTAPSAGGAGALPATPLGYLTVNINGTDRKIAYYA